MKKFHLSMSVCIMGMFFCACTATVVPQKIESDVATWDGKNQNSGFIAYAPSGAGIITPHGRERYNALVGIYGQRFTPPIGKDDGIMPLAGNFLIDPEHLAKYMQMNRWNKADPLK